MRPLLVLFAALLFSGCFGKGTHKQHDSVRSGGDNSFAAGPSSGNQKLIVTPGNSLVGKVTFVSATARFVVLTFPIGHLPAIEQRLNVFRSGLKVGEIKVTGPQYDDNIVADVLAGDAEMGDEVRDR